MRLADKPLLLAVHNSVGLYSEVNALKSDGRRYASVAVPEVPPFHNDDAPAVLPIVCPS